VREAIGCPREGINSKSLKTLVSRSKKVNELTTDDIIVKATLR
jgi:hypothetical protein